MSKIIISDEMEKDVVEEIKKLGEVDYLPKNLSESLQTADALIVRSKTQVTKELLTHAPKLKLVLRGGVGLDNVDAVACKERGIKVLNTPGASSNAVAELTIGHIFSAKRFIAKAHLQIKNKIWDKKGLVGTELDGATLGLIGYGRIGALVGKKAAALGMKIIAYNPPPRQEDGIAKFVELDELFAKADVISIHVPSLPETKGMINSASIAKMKKTAVIINTSRGDIINEDDLYEACKAGIIAGACLDVFSQEPYTGKLLELDNVYLTPHLGANTKEAQLRIGAELVKLLKENL
ncbi:MAG: hydroxyacid dehydrogenase [Candidatus Micrarchaeota archaeon]